MADSSTLGTEPAGVFITTNNTVYATGFGIHSVLVWQDGSVTAIQSLFNNLSLSHSAFVTLNGDVYADNGLNYGQVEKWTMDTNSVTISMHVSGKCGGVFVDIYDSLYCSQPSSHQVLQKNVDSDPGATVIVAGNGVAGPESYTLDEPYGIFVDMDLSLYVADHNNNRVQLFRSGATNGTTVAGNGAPDTITLNHPDMVILDGAGYLFIVDRFNSRIVASGPNGFRCIAACSGSSGSAANELFLPFGLSFDSYGNLFICDTSNSRLQKFILAKNACGE